jgi:hypothetical protein
VKQSNHGFANDGDTAIALVPATRDHQYFFSAIHLLLAKPGFRSRRRRGGRWQRVAQIQRAFRAESHLVERLSQSFEPFAPL